MHDTVNVIVYLYIKIAALNIDVNRLNYALEKKGKLIWKAANVCRLYKTKVEDRK